jgi:UDP-N-acetylglucosamine 2-epimerase
MIYEIEKVLLKENPHFVLLYGDTNSTVSGAIAASKIPIKIAHVEAGLRSFNRRMPEEVNRVLTDHISDLLFCPTKTAVANLKKEGIEKGVYLVGDVMYDSILYNKISADIKKQINDKLHISGTGRGSRYIIATVHRAENTDHISRLSAIFSAMSKIPERIILPLHPRTYKIIKKNKLSYGKNIEIIEPLAYKEMLCLIKNAYMVMTDSGGIQKEAFMFGTPCITLREETEWLETVKAGMNKLAGHAEEEILRSYNDFKLNAPKLPTEANKYYGDADAAQRIIDILKK